MEAEKDRRKRRRRQRTFIKAKVAREMWEEEKQKIDEFKVPLEKIYYADSPEVAAKVSLDAIERINECKEDEIPVGFDTEGSIETLQLFFSIDGAEWGVVFQLNRIIINGRAPEEMCRLLTHCKIRPCGRCVTPICVFD